MRDRMTELRHEGQRIKTLAAEIRSGELSTRQIARSAEDIMRASERIEQLAAG